MTHAQLKTVKMITAMMLGIIVSISIVHRNIAIPVIAIAIAFAILIPLRSRVTEVLADERDIMISGKASRLAIQIYSFVVIIPMLILYAMRDQNPFYEPIASILAYSLCFLMVVYTMIYHFYDRISLLGKKVPYLILTALVIAILTIIGLRAMSGEDDWICSKGTWVRHGNPSFPAPTTPCR